MWFTMVSQMKEKSHYLVNLATITLGSIRSATVALYENFFGFCHKIGKLKAVAATKVLFLSMDIA